MQIVTWNVAGLNARLHRVKLWIEENQPDVLCLQETKMTDEVFSKKAKPIFDECIEVVQMYELSPVKL